MSSTSSIHTHCVHTCGPCFLNEHAQVSCGDQDIEDIGMITVDKITGEYKSHTTEEWRDVVKARRRRRAASKLGGLRGFACRSWRRWRGTRGSWRRSMQCV